MCLAAPIHRDVRCPLRDIDIVHGSPPLKNVQAMAMALASSSAGHHWVIPRNRSSLETAGVVTRCDGGGCRNGGSAFRRRVFAARREAATRRQAAKIRRAALD